MYWFSSLHLFSLTYVLCGLTECWYNIWLGLKWFCLRKYEHVANNNRYMWEPFLKSPKLPLIPLDGHARVWTQITKHWKPTPLKSPSLKWSCVCDPKSLSIETHPLKLVTPISGIVLLKSNQQLQSVVSLHRKALLALRCEIIGCSAVNQVTTMNWLV